MFSLFLLALPSLILCMKIYIHVLLAAVLVTDEHNSYKYLCHKESIEHIVVNSKCHSYGTYSLSRINALHSSLDRCPAFYHFNVFIS